MKNLTLLSLALALALFVGARDARAQFQFEIGPRIGYAQVQNDFDIDDLEFDDDPTDDDLRSLGEDVSGLALGLDLRLSSAGLPVQINPTFDFYVLSKEEFDRFTLWRITTNALYEFGSQNVAFTPYVGPGVSFTRSSFEFQPGLSDAEVNTDIGLNIVGGAGFDAGPAKLFIQGEYVVFGDFKPFGVSVGALFNFDGGQE